MRLPWQQWARLFALFLMLIYVGLSRAAAPDFLVDAAWLQSKALGYKDVRVMNGGWSQWDRALTLPVVQGDAPFDADFSL